MCEKASPAMIFTMRRMNVRQSYVKHLLRRLGGGRCRQHGGARNSGKRPIFHALSKSALEWRR
jgi:hypothetical protein